MSSVTANTKFKITNTKLYVSIVTLSTEGNVKLTKKLSERFKRSVYWNQCKIEIKTREMGNNNPLKIMLDASFQDVKRPFVLAFKDTTVDADNNPIANNTVKRDSHQKYFLPRVNVADYNVLIDGVLIN